MATEGMSMDVGGSQARFDVVAVEPDARERTRLAIQLAGTVGAVHDTVDALTRALEAGRPTVAVFGPGFATETGLAQAQRLARSRPEVGVVLVVEEMSTDLLQHALRAGVRDAVTLDADESQLRQAVERAGDAVADLGDRDGPDQPARRGRVVVAFSTKGGVGKSVVATNLASALAQRDGLAVAVVDADLQFGDVAVLLGIPPDHTTLDAVRAAEADDPDMLDELLGTHGATGLRVLPAPVEPAAADGIAPAQMVAIVEMLRGRFDYVVVDMPPHFDDVVLALIEHADDVILVASMDIPSIKNLKVGIQTLDLLSLAGDKLQLVLNRANAKVNLDVDDVERAVGIAARHRVPSDIAVPQAVNRGVPVVVDRPRSAAALALAALADSIHGAAPEHTEAAAARRRPWRR